MYGLSQKSGENVMQLTEQLFFLQRLRFGMLRLVAHHTVLDMIGQQFNAQRIQGGADGGNLIQDINAISVLLNHPLYSGNLTYHAINAFFNFLLAAWIHRYTYTPYWYLTNGESIARPETPG
jgi:hypothetical protein